MLKGRLVSNCLLLLIGLECLASVQVLGFTSTAVSSRASRTSVQRLRESSITPTSILRSELQSRSITWGRNAVNFKATSTTTTTSLNSDATNGEIDYNKLKPQVYKQRWVQLAYLSLLALLSDWICFSVAAAPSTFESAYAGHSAANLIDIFLFTNVASCFLVTDTVSRFGLEKATADGVKEALLKERIC